MSIVPPLPKGVDPVREQELIDWERSAKYMSLKEMCEALDIDYSELKDKCIADVKAELKIERPFFDHQLDAHLKRLRLEAVRNPDILKAYI